MLKRSIQFAVVAVLSTHIFASAQTTSDLNAQNSGPGGTYLLERLTYLLSKNQYLVVRDKDTGKIYNSRAANFTFNYFEDGSITRGNLVLEGYADSDTKFKKSNEYIDIKIPTHSISPESTTTIAVVDANLSANDIVPLVPFNVGDTASYNFQSTGIVYDLTGVTHILNIFYVKKSFNQWSVPIVLDNAVIATGVATFSYNGELTDVAGLNNISVHFNDVTQAIKLKLSLTQYGGINNPGRVLNDGSGAGSFNNFTINDTGAIFADYSNGQTKQVAQIAMK
jgi:flagellar hook protein FlgE